MAGIAPAFHLGGIILRFRGQDLSNQSLARPGVQRGLSVGRNTFIRRSCGLTLFACLAKAKIIFDHTGLITDDVDHVQ